MTTNPFALHDHLELLFSKLAEEGACRQDFRADKQAVDTHSRQAAVLQLLGLLPCRPQRETRLPHPNQPGMVRELVVKIVRLAKENPRWDTARSKAHYSS